MASQLELRERLLKLFRRKYSFPIARKNTLSIIILASNTGEIVPNLAIEMYINEKLQIFRAVGMMNKFPKSLRVEKMLIF